ncbi:MAG: T9SS type A sorting domain-containing protein [Armatimonadetes bacterium]|nr:T9SS type A sorting domain-containing protein [Armatimonadota bacterium]
MKTIITTTAACLFALILALPSANAQDINILWEKTYSDSILGQGYALSTVPVHDGFLIGGRRVSPVTGYSGLLIRTDHNGNLIWRKLYPEMERFAIHGFDDSLLLIYGKIKPKSEYDPTPDIFIGLMDFNGNIQWVHRFTYWESFTLFAKRNGGVCAFGRVDSDSSDLMAIQFNKNGDSLSTHHFSLFLYSYLGGYSFVLPNNKVVITGAIPVGMPLSKFGSNYPIDVVMAIVDLEGSGSISSQQLKLDWTNDEIIGHQIVNDSFDLLIARRYWADNDSIPRGRDTTGLAVYRFDYSGNYTLIKSSTSPLEKTDMVGGARPLHDGSWVSFGIRGLDAPQFIYISPKGNPVVYGEGTPFAVGLNYNIAVYDSSCFILSGVSKDNLPRIINVCVESEITASPLDQTSQDRPSFIIRSGSLYLDFHNSNHPTLIELYDLQGKKLQSINPNEIRNQIIVPLQNHPHGFYYCIVKTDKEVYSYPFYY